jgi:hypothetical protein
MRTTCCLPAQGEANDQRADASVASVASGVAHHVLRLAVPNKTPSTIAAEPAATPVKTYSKNVEKFDIFKPDIGLPLSANLR